MISKENKHIIFYRSIFRNNYNHSKWDDDYSWTHIHLKKSWKLWIAFKNVL